MVSWSGDPGLAGYDGPASRFLGDQFFFASPGSVDLNGVTRLGVQLNTALFPESAYRNKFVVNASVTFTSGDITANSIAGDRRLGVSMYVAADQWPTGVVPTPGQIRDAAKATGYVVRSTTSVTSAGTHDFTILGPRPAQARRYWVMILPTVKHGGQPATADSKLDGTDSNVLGRALSVWTNRTPLAPTITAPVTGTQVAPGDQFTLTYSTNDPDTVTPDDADRLNRDLAGVEFQYAPQATAENPNPTWLPLKFSPTGGGPLGQSWSIRGMTAPAFYEPYEFLRKNLGGVVRVGIDDGSTVAKKANIPAGNWQIRCRTFDFGHPYPKLTGPLGRTAGTLTPANYPAQNTSPWSEAIRIFVPAQVPPPVIITPKDNIAVPVDLDVRLEWQYRNAHVPPYDQAERTVQIREVGDPDWTTVFSGAGADPYVLLSPDDFPMLVNTQYEWQVQVTDTDGEMSTYSSIARFWIVPSPSTGDLRPVPSSTIDGATLGCGHHKVEVYRRGGLVRVAELDSITYLDWSRVRDEISTAKVVISGWGIDCGNLLSLLETWAYEIVITRDNGASVDRVWEGPITLLTYEADKVTIQAKDVMGYAYRRIIKQKLSDNVNGATVVDRARRVIQNAFAPDDPNILGYLTVISQEDDAKQYRSTPAYSRTAYEEVDDMAANSGLDYTVIGRSILLWGTKHRIGTLPEFRDENLGSSPIVSEYGMSMANRYVVSDGNGVWGEATRLDVSGNDEKYGLVEMLSSTWASDSTADSGTYTQAGLQKVQQSFSEFAERSIKDRYGPPVIVRIPDNTSLNPNSLISIQQLVPGVAIPLRSTSTLREVIGTQKLDSVTVTETDGKEVVAVVMSAFNRDDASAGGGEEGEGGGDLPDPGPDYMDFMLARSPKWLAFFDEADGSSVAVTDYSGNNVEGIYDDSVNLGAPGIMAGLPGRTCAEFGGSPAWGGLESESGNANNAWQNDPTNVFVVWFKAVDTTLGSPQNLFSRANLATFANWGFWLTTAGKLHAEIADGVASCTGTTTIPDDTLTMATFYYDKTTLRIFLNDEIGTPEASVAYTADMPVNVISGAQFGGVGAPGFSLNWFLNGEIQSIAAFDPADFPVSDIPAAYTAGVTAP